jgi:hypothetical protein
VTNKPISGAVDLWSSAYKIYKKYFSEMVVLAALPAVINLFYSFHPVVAYNTANLTYPAVVLFIIVVLSIFYYLLMSGTITLMASGQEINQAVRSALSNVFGLFITYVLVILGVMVGFLLLIIPGIVFSIWASQVLPIVFIENKSGSAAIKRSIELVKGRSWAVLGRLLFPILPFLAVSLLGVFGRFGVALSSLVGAVVITPISLIYGYKLYKSLA